MPARDRAPPAPRLAVLGVLLAILCRVAFADPSVPWTPTVGSRHALELLADGSGLALPLTHWPLPRAAVTRALDALPREVPPALDAARERVAAELRAAEDRCCAEQKGPAPSQTNPLIRLVAKGLRANGWRLRMTIRRPGF